MANEKPVKHYESLYVKDEVGEFYRVTVPFKKGFVELLIDLADFEDFAKYNWSVLSVRGEPKYLSRHYRTTDKEPRKRQQLHQFIMDVKDSTPIDHIDGNGFNCRRYNMRIATRTENAQNRIKRAKGTSQYKGVVWNKANKTWLAQIKYNKVAIHLGTFHKKIIGGIDEGEIKAARAYDKAAIKYFGTFALTNFPGDRDMVQTLKGEHFTKSYLFNEREVRIIENKIRELTPFKKNEIMEIMEVMPLQEIVNICHYYGCGIEEVVKEIKQGVVIDKKYA